MARKICNHPVLPSLRARLVANKIYECPTCRIRLYICEIEEVQAALERRSGIFESRTKAREAEEKEDNSERLVHSALVKRWRLAKIGLYRDFCLFEEFRDEEANKTSSVLQLGKAFELWEEVKDDRCTVPGYIHLQEAVGHIESGEEPETVQSVDYSQKQDVKLGPGSEDDGGWQTVRWKARPVKQSSDRTAPDQAPSTTCGKGTDLKAQNHDKVIQSIEVPLKIAHGSYWDGRNRFDLLRDIELDEYSKLFDTPEVKATSTILDRSVAVDVCGTSCNRTVLGISPLKRKRSSTSPNNSQARKNVHVGDNVTVICDADACNTTGLPPGQSSFTRPHFSYATAEKARRRRNFWRRSSFYRPRTWALTGDYENFNTSHFKTTWAEHDAIIGLQRWAEKREKDAKQFEASTKLETRDDPANMQVGVYAPPAET